MNLDDFTRSYWKHMLNPMPKNEQNDILKKSIEFNGIETERVIIMEELSELIQEVSKQYRGKGIAMHLLEEMADVYICLEELKLMTGINNHDIEAAMSVKYERIKNDIESKKSKIAGLDLHESSGLLED
mgnify:CR=1 FL=1